MEKKMILMTGLQGSGKTEFVRRFLGEYVHISLDLLHTRNNELRAINECIAEGKNFVIDNTNPTKEDRKRYISLAAEYNYRVVGVFMQSILKDCIERNNKREGKAKVPEKAIVGTMNKLELPDYSEGYDELYFARIAEKEIIIDEWR